MVEIREMKPGDDVMLMDFIQSRQIPSLLVLEQTDRIFLFLERERLQGFLALRPLTESLFQLFAIETGTDHWAAQDGLLRIAFHILQNRQDSWVLAEEGLVERLLALKDTFRSIDELDEIQEHWFSVRDGFQDKRILAVPAGVIYQGSCKGASEI